MSILPRKGPRGPLGSWALLLEVRMYNKVPTGEKNGKQVEELLRELGSVFLLLLDSSEELLSWLRDIWFIRPPRVAACLRN
ncbi:hypothetical protein TNIN_217391 [Trichonephila inaurata madagascariensis]|uniref:Uncharacterized protein n=1 Tax=Trichonephila inaurata madagascariensis TaxID=2747483 RepID=A0A8X6Y1D8_9ARAC|nr:hypothetical protein TNIN_217391 [Trichonephila inaurata madagascariensis]